MRTRTYSRKKRKSSDSAPVVDTSESMFESRAFTAQPKTDSAADVPTGNLNSSLNQASRFGHRLDRVSPQATNASQPVQRKLTVGQPGDRYEQEADHVAAKVVNQVDPSAASDVSTARRKKRKSNDPVGVEIQPIVQRDAVSGESAATSSTEQAIEKKRGNGSALPDAVRGDMEGAFGADFGGVRVHTDGESDQLNRSLSSRAFTTGNDIFFKKGEYNPTSRSGKELLAHELTHTVQQGAAPSVQQKTLLQREGGNEAADNAQDNAQDDAQDEDQAPKTQDDVRAELGQVDLQGGNAAILTSDTQIVTEMKDVLTGSGKLVMASDLDQLAQFMATDKNIEKAAAAKMIADNQGRGFTGKDGTIYVVEGAASGHDIVHETVHVCSAPGGKTQILAEFGESLNEGFTEYFTKQFCAKLGVADAEAYPNQVAFITQLANAVGVAPLHTAYLQNAGMDALINQIATLWETKAQTNKKLLPQPNAKDHGKNCDNVRSKFKNFDPGNAPWMKFWKTFIF